MANRMMDMPNNNGKMANTRRARTLKDIPVGQTSNGDRRSTEWRNSRSGWCNVAGRAPLVAIVDRTCNEWQVGRQPGAPIIETEQPRGQPSKYQPDVLLKIVRFVGFGTKFFSLGDTAISEPLSTVGMVTTSSAIFA